MPDRPELHLPRGDWDGLSGADERRLEELAQIRLEGEKKNLEMPIAEIVPADVLGSPGGAVSEFCCRFIGEFFAGIKAVTSPRRPLVGMIRRAASLEIKRAEERLADQGTPSPFAGTLREGIYTLAMQGQEHVLATHLLHPKSTDPLRPFPEELLVDAAVRSGGQTFELVNRELNREDRQAVSRGLEWIVENPLSEWIK